MSDGRRAISREILPAAPTVPLGLDVERGNSMGVLLVSLDGLADIALGHAPILVGRDPSCEARIESARISRRHCCLAPDGSGVFVRDLGSTNGTRINGSRVESGRLALGDELAVAQVRFRLVRCPPPAPPAGPIPPAPAPAGPEGPLPGTVLADPDGAP